MCEEKYPGIERRKQHLTPKDDYEGDDRRGQDIALTAQEKRHIAWAMMRQDFCNACRWVADFRLYRVKAHGFSRYAETGELIFCYRTSNKKTEVVTESVLFIRQMAAITLFLATLLLVTVVFWGAVLYMAFTNYTAGIIVWGLMFVVMFGILLYAIFHPATDPPPKEKNVRYLGSMLGELVGTVILIILLYMLFRSGRGSSKKEDATSSEDGEKREHG